MKGNKQATLFQSWGNQKKEVIQLSSITERAVAASSSRDDGVIDLCESFDDDDDGLLCEAEETVNLELNNHDIRDNGEETNDWPTETDYHEEEKECNISIGAENFTLTQKQTQCKTLPGFDLCAGKLWIYPTNYPVRDYQFNIVQQALFKNTMVTLPTGLGKTFIAAVVMYNFYRWYPQGKVVFMAPTKPLVAQQIEACYNIMGIPQDHTAEMTGSMGPPKREKAWQEKRVFFLTPQVLTNDLSRGSCPAEDIKCLVIDEAHKALGNHAYCQVVRELVKYTENFRVLALSATPGSDIKAVQQVLTNLLISHIEIRTEESIDIKQYSHERKVEKVVVPLGDELTKVKEKYVHIMDVVVSRLKKQGVIYNRDTTSLSKFLILKSREAFRQNPPERLPRSQYGVVEGDFALAMSLYHGYELLQLHGSRSLYNFLEGVLTGDKGYGRTRAELTKNGDFNQLMDLLTTKYTVHPREADSDTGTIKPFVIGHPKMEKLQDIVLDHFNSFAQQGASATRVMIFSQYRDSVKEITDMLHVHQPLVKVMSFIGQSSAGKSTKGFTQKEQLKVMKQFRDGGYNTLVSTCVGEEGLDIGDVDLIVCFDAHKSPIRLVQRMGRTGRKREGRIVMLVTQGKEEQIYNQSQYSKKSIHKAILNGAKSLHFYQHSPRMVPEQLSPKYHKMHITVKEAFKPSKRISTESKTDQSKITSLFNNGKKDEEEELITLDQYQELQLWQVDKHTIPQLPDPDMICLDKRGIGQVSTESSEARLSLSEWSPWQNTLQQYDKVGHSVPSKRLVQLMEFTQLQQSLEPGDDPYGLEMAAYLNEDDVLKPGESEAAPESILRYCVSNKLLENRNSKKKGKSKLVRRSDTLPNFEDDNKDAVTTSDEDLPSFALSPKQIHQYNNEDKQMNNNCSKNAGNNNQNDQPDVENLKVTKVENSQKMHVVDHIADCYYDATSKKTAVGSRVKSLERKMSESILRKSKKRRRSKGNSGNRTVVELIADNDSSDFDGVDSNISNETKNFSSSIAENGRDDGQTGDQEQNIEQNYQSNNSVVRLEHDVESSFTTCYKIGSPPPIDEVVALCEDLDSHFDAEIDLIQLVDGWEKENSLRKYFVKPNKSLCFDKNPDHFQLLDMDGPNQEQTHAEPNQRMSELDNTHKESTKTAILHKHCNDISSSEFSKRLSKRVDSPKVDHRQRLTGKEKCNHMLSNDRSDFSYGLSYAEVPYDKKLVSDDKKLVSEKHGINIQKSTAKIKITDSPDEASLVLARPDFISTVVNEREFPSEINKNDSWLTDSMDAELANVLRTQAAQVNQVRDLETATQVTFTQALASVHSSVESESDIADRLQQNQMIKNNQDLKPKQLLSETRSNGKNFQIHGSFLQYKDNRKDFRADKSAIVADTSATELPVESCGNQFSRTEGLSGDMSYQEDDTKQHKTLKIANVIGGLNSDMKADLTCEKKLISFDQGISDIETDLPQFDLGFDIDDDIIPPSPNATQQSQKSVSESISQSFSSRMSQSRLSIAFSKKQEIEQNTDSKSRKKETLEQEGLSYHTNKRVQNHTEKNTLLPEVMLIKMKQSANLDVIPTDRVTDDDSTFESKTRKASSPQLNEKIDRSNPEIMHDVVLTQADLQLSLSPVDEPSFCLMDEGDLEDLYEAESTLTENRHAETDKTTPLVSVDSNRRHSESENLVPKTVQGSVCWETSNDQSACNSTGTKISLQSKVAKVETSYHVNCLDEGNDDVLYRDKAALKTPINQFKNRKSVFTLDDFSPDPFSDSFEFNIEQSSKTDNSMTALKSKSKAISVASSTPKQVYCEKDSIKLTTKSKDSPEKLQFKLENDQKINLHSESDSDDSFIVRRKKKPCIIESPCNQIQEDKENVSYDSLKVLRTPGENRLITEVKKKTCDLKKQSNKSNNLQEKNKGLSVSFLSNDDDNDFEDTLITKQQYVLPKTVSFVQECASNEDFDEPYPGKKKFNTRTETDHHLKDSSQLPAKLRKKRGSNPFIEEEAELSDDENWASSDESEHGLDHYEASFIHDTQQCSQLQAIDQADMQAVYMKSVRSPAGPGRFKLQYNYKNENVFSQIPEEESQYMEDSFCVAEVEDEWLGNEEIEPEEVTIMNSEVTLLRSGRKRRQKGITKVFQTGREKALHQGRMNALNKIKSKIAKKNQNVPKRKIDTDESEKKPKRHRIRVLDDSVTVIDTNTSENQLPDSGSPKVKIINKRTRNRVFSSSDEEEDKETVNKVKKSIIDDSAADTADETLTKLKSKPDCLRETLSCESDSYLLLTDGKHIKHNCKAVILVDSKEISGSQDIISNLRFKHGIQVSAAQLSGCDYIISNRMAVERKLWSEFSNGANRAKLTERIQALIDLYDRAILIVEKDKVKVGEEKYTRPLHWTKYVDKTVALLLRSNVRVLYTDSQLETASLLADLCELEKRKGMGIAAHVELTPDQQNKVKFFTTVPKLSYIHALNLCQGFRSIAEFMRSSIQMIQTKGQMSENRAIDVYKFLRRQFDANNLST